MGLMLSGTILHVEHVEACPDLGPICAQNDVAPYQHDQHLYTNDLVGDFELGLVPMLALHVIAGVRQVTDRIRYLDLAGAPYAPPVPDYHHRNETLVGVTDPWILLHVGPELGGSWALSLQGGVTLPFGSTVENPFALGRLGLPHEHIQLGTGTIDLAAGASIERQFDAFRLSLFTLDRFTVFTNHFGYRAGHRILAGLDVKSGLGLDDFVFGLGLDLFRETAERWSGIVESEGNIGRTDLFVDANVAWAFSKAWSARLGVKVPIWSRANGEQVSYPAILTVGIAGRPLEP
jgi:hypothetical protein